MAMIRSLVRLVRREDGQSLSEYTLILFLIVLVAVAALTLFGQTLAALYNNFVNAF